MVDLREERMLLSLIHILTGLVLAGKLYKTMIHPIKSIQKGAREIRDGVLDHPVEVYSKDELGEVCGDFEEMRVRLKESVELQQRYESSRKELIAGISHDLSTPLTSIKGYAGGILDGVANTPEKQKHYLCTIYDTACDMEGLVDNLFLFSKLDMGKMCIRDRKWCSQPCTKKAGRCCVTAPMISLVLFRGHARAAQNTRGMTALWEEPMTWSK